MRTQSSRQDPSHELPAEIRRSRWHHIPQWNMAPMRFNPNRLMAEATVSSKRFDAPICAEGAATQGASHSWQSCDVARSGPFPRPMKCDHATGRLGIDLVDGNAISQSTARLPESIRSRQRFPSSATALPFPPERGPGRRLVHKKRGSLRSPVPRQSGSVYSMILLTTPAPTVRPPSRMAKRRPCSMAIGAINSTPKLTLSPGITISVPSASVTVPVTSVVRK